MKFKFDGVNIRRQQHETKEKQSREIITLHYNNLMYAIKLNQVKQQASYTVKSFIPGYPIYKPLRVIHYLVQKLDPSKYTCTVDELQNTIHVRWKNKPPPDEKKYIMQILNAIFDEIKNTAKRTQQEYIEFKIPISITLDNEKIKRIIINVLTKKKFTVRMTNPNTVHVSW